MNRSTIIILIILLVTGAYLLYDVFKTTGPDNPSNNSTIIPANYTPSTIGALKTVVDSNNQFAIDLYNKYKDDPEYKNENIFYSPYSISTALTMTYEGAKGTTADEMQKVLHIPTDSDKRKQDFKELYENLNKADKEYKLSTANALWAEKTYNFLDEYKNTILNYYGGETTNLDFKNKPEDSRVTINNWVEEQTNDKIKDLIPSGLINSMTRMVLTNAIYFKADWILPFEKESTHDEDFTLSDNSKIKVKMMHQINDFNYAEDNKIQILEMNYKGNDLSMLIILPKSNNIKDAEDSFANINELKNSLKSEKVSVSLPKFKFETKYMMANTLSEIGMPTAFSPGDADFSGMDGTRNLYISEVVHQAFVAVDENGTEAAAATAVIMYETSIPTTPEPEPKIFKADHPFIFLIQDKNSGEILFMGRVEKPSE